MSIGINGALYSKTSWSNFALFFYFKPTKFTTDCEKITGKKITEVWHCGQHYQVRDLSLWRWGCVWMLTVSGHWRTSLILTQSNHCPRTSCLHDLPWDLLSMEEVPLMMVSERYRDLDLELSPSLKKGLSIKTWFISIENFTTTKTLGFNQTKV